MKVGGKPCCTIWTEGRLVFIIDQTRLPHAFETVRLRTVEDAARAISDMLVRGAPLIGATAAYGVALAMAADPSDEALRAACARLIATRPTASNLRWALERMSSVLEPLPPAERMDFAFAEAARICEEDVETCRAIGRHGLGLIEEIAARKAGPVNVLTHCNAGWLACVDWGTATSPLYQAHDKGIDLHVWVDETRPRNQGGALTAWELAAHGVPHTVIVDNAGGHLMRRGLVDLCITGTDRVAANGDVANKIGTYLKALAAQDNGVPFYVALPHSTIDWTTARGEDIPIEDRPGTEVSRLAGRTADGAVAEVEIVNPGSPVANPAFDVTPARLVAGFITERGLCPANGEGLRSLYPECAA
ncbi:MAG: S-methyl-5-thioribose-1-phosphate isomerase [Alphaproteobacteria bacterium]